MPEEADMPIEVDIPEDKTVEVLPVPLFTTSESTYFVDDEIEFKNESTDATSYLWSFGDGTTSTDESPKHTYSIGGSYDVSLEATGEGGKVAVSNTLEIKDYFTATSGLWEGNYQGYENRKSPAIMFYVSNNNLSAVGSSLCDIFQCYSIEYVLEMNGNVTRSIPSDETYLILNNSFEVINTLVGGTATCNGTFLSTTECAGIVTWEGVTYNFTASPVE